MDCHANALAAACAFACHKTSWLVRHGPRPLVLGFPTSPSTSATSSSTFSVHAPPVVQTILVFPGLGWLREVKRHCAVPTLPVSLAHLPESPPPFCTALLCCPVLAFRNLVVGASRNTQHQQHQHVDEAASHSVSAARLGCLLRRQNAAAVLGSPRCSSWLHPAEEVRGGARISGERTGRDRSVCCNESVGAVVLTFNSHCLHQ